MGPDYPDPTTFLNMFVTDGPFNKMSYSNKQYGELIEKTSSTLATDLPARWKAFQDAEKYYSKMMQLSLQSSNQDLYI